MPKAKNWDEVFCPFKGLGDHTSAQKRHLAAGEVSAFPHPHCCSAPSTHGLSSFPLTGLGGLCMWGTPGVLCAESRPITQSVQPWASERTSLNLFSSWRSVDGGLRGLSVCRWPRSHWVCACSIAQPCLTLCSPMNCSLPDSSVHGIFQAGILECLPSPSPGIFPTHGLNPRLLRWQAYSSLPHRLGSLWVLLPAP